MVNARIATGAEQPINRDGAVAGEEYEEGDLVAIDEEDGLVKADATDGVQAAGVAFAPATDLDNYDDEYMPEIVKTTVNSERSLVGRDRTAFGSYGFIVENSDEDWEFDVNEPVYLGDDGGYTQDPPDTEGSVEQVVGVATDDGNAVFVSIDYNYTEN